MKTIKENITTTYEINKSTFITLLFKVSKKEEINTYIKQTKEKYKDATHYCYAYIIDDYKKSSDDGEPGGTAGVPIMEVLLKNDINYILCIVVRYFGGIKLGAGGLVRAYSKSTTLALKNVELLDLIDGFKIELEATYSDQSIIENILKDSNYSKEYNETVKYIANIETETLNTLTQKNITFKLLENIKIEKRSN